MRPKYLYIIILSVIILSVILVLRAAGSSPHSTVIPTDSLPEKVMPVERVEVQIDARTLASNTNEPVITQGTSLKDGPTLLEEHCARCHAAQFLEKIKQPRAEWEKTLAQMEALGVRLEDTEKDILLNYLTVADEP